MDWVEEFLARLESATNGVLEVKIDGKKIAAKVGDDLSKFFKDNRKLLVRIGKDTFKSFLLLVYEKKNEEAFQLLLAKMSADEIILRMEQNASELKELNDRRDVFVNKLKSFATKTLLPTTVKLVLKLIL